jgi:GTP-binding protein HflX
VAGGASHARADRAVGSAPGGAVLVALDFGATDHAESREELRLLALSAAVRVVGVVEGRRHRPDPALFAGSGKVAEIARTVADARAALVIFNHELSPAQQRNLERELGCRVVDRTTLILDIFAQRASSHEGKVQVELAQLQHLATRLVRGWTHLERQKGGIGLRGPGETQLETDRRLLGKRVKVLKERLVRLGRQRTVQRRARMRGEVLSVSIVGYTNAGKSTLFNALTRAGAYAADQLFATLDTTTRRLYPWPAAHAGRGIPRDAGGDGARRSAPARGGRVEHDARAPDRGGQQGAGRDRRRCDSAAPRLEQDRPERRNSGNRPGRLW